MSPGIIAGDSKQHIRHGERGMFRGLIGVVLNAEEPDDFRARYDDILGSFFSLYGKLRERKIYKSSEIGSLFPGRRSQVLQAYRYLARFIVSLPSVKINVYYLTLDLAELRQRIAEGETVDRTSDLESRGSSAELVTFYGELGSEGAKLVSVTDFFREVREYFPIVCAWKLCAFLGLRKAQVVVDGCKGSQSHAWQELVSTQDLTIAFHGAMYNPYLSAADVLLKWIDEELRESGLPLNQTALTRVLTEWRGVTEDLSTDHIHMVHFTNRDLKDIVPLARARIDRFEDIYARHPIFFIFKEENTEEQRAMIENSPKMQKIYNLIYEEDGSLVWWDPNIHCSLVRAGDKAVVFGPNGLKEAEFLVKAEYPLTIIRSEDI